MVKWSHSTFATILLMMLSASLSAQNQPRSPAADKLATRQVIASASDNSIRFTALGERIQMRLEVIDSGGETVLDSDFRSGNVIDWRLTDRQGQQLADGTYVCVVAVRDSSGYTTRRCGVASVQNRSIGLKQLEGSLLTSAQAEAAGAVSGGEGVNLTIIESGSSSATAVLAHDGETAHLVSSRGGFSISSGDFFGNKLIEHVRLTAEGNVGIGITNPLVKLDVNGLVRASQGIVFPDGSIQYSAATKTYGAKSTLPLQSKSKNSSGGQEHIEAVSLNVIPKADNGGNLVNTVAPIFETVGGNVGIGTTSPDPFRLNINGNLNVGGSNLYLGGNLRFTDNAAAGYTNFVALNGNLTNFDGVNYEQLNLFNPGGDKAIHLAQTASGSQIASTGPGNTTLSLQPSGGNVAIGAITPSSKLDIADNSGHILLGGAGCPAGFNAIGFGSVFSSCHNYSIGGDGTNAIINRPTGGIISFRENNGEQMRIVSGGNVGINTTSPTANLDVADFSGAAPIHFRTALGDGGGYLISNSDAQAIISGGAKWDGSDWVAKSTAASLVDNNNGAIQFFANSGLTAGSNFSPTERMRITAAGNVGIGITSPSAKLHIADNGGHILLGGSGCGAGFTGIAFGTTSPDCTNYSLLGDEKQTVINSPGNRNSSPLPQITFRLGGNDVMYLRPDTYFGDNSVRSGDLVIPVSNNGSIILQGDLLNQGESLLCYHTLQNSSDHRIDGCGSSIRLKNNVNPFDAGLSLIRRLRPVSFDWKSNGKHDIGLIAEAVDEVEPLLATRNDKGEAAGVKYEKLPVVLINAVKEQQAQIEQQQEQIKTQQARIQRQQAEIDGLKRLVCASHPRASLCKPRH